MSDIPADIMRTARTLADDATCLGYTHAALDIARAILAERERCAQIAANTVDFADDGLSTFDAAQIIAAAIRSPERAGE